MFYVERWRNRAERMLKLAMTVSNKRMSEWLSFRANEYLNHQAAAREATERASEAAPQVTQQTQQPQPDQAHDPEKKE